MGGRLPGQLQGPEFEFHPVLLLRPQCLSSILMLTSRGGSSQS